MKLLGNTSPRFIRNLYGCFLVGLPFLNLPLLFDDFPGSKWNMTPYSWLLILTITISISYILLAMFGPTVERLLLKTLIPPIRILRCIAVVILPIVLFLVSYNIFGHSPLLIDTIVQLFQAEIFQYGKFKASLPPLKEFFVTQHMIFDEGWYGQYPPGHSVILLLGNLLGEPLLISIVLAVSTTVILYKFVAGIYNQSIAKLSLFLILVSPFFIFMSASYMNHVSTLFLLLSFLYYFSLWEKSNKWSHLFLSGLFLGLTVTIRPLDGIPCGLSIIIPTLILLKKRPYALIVGLCSLLPGLLLLLWYNSNTTGNAFLPGYLKLWGEGHKMGFHMNPWGREHTLLIGLRNELADLQLLQEMLFEWAIPSLLPVALLLLSPIKLTSWDRRLLAYTVLCPIAYGAYWHRDAFLGPRFEYCTIIAWIPLSARAIIELSSYFKNKNVHIFKLFKPVQLTSLIKLILVFSLSYEMFLAVPQRAGIYRSSMSSFKTNIRDEALKSNIPSGLIFVKLSWGARIFSELRGMGLSATDAQRAYSFLDHCKLFILTKDSREQGLNKTEFTRLINRLHDTEPRAQKVRANFDSSLKLNMDTGLDPQCKEELLYDVKNGRPNYTTYEPHMRANTPNFSGEYIIAKDLRSRNYELRKFYPNLKAYIYNGKEFKLLTP